MTLIVICRNHGATSIPLLDGKHQVGRSIVDGNPVLSVTVNYRIGVWGFMAHEALRDQSDGGSVGNCACCYCHGRESGGSLSAASVPACLLSTSLSHSVCLPI